MNHVKIRLLILRPYNTRAPTFSPIPPFPLFPLPHYTKSDMRSDLLAAPRCPAGCPAHQAHNRKRLASQQTHLDRAFAGVRMLRAITAGAPWRRLHPRRIAGSLWASEPSIRRPRRKTERRKAGKITQGGGVISHTCVGVRCFFASLPFPCALAMLSAAACQSRSRLPQITTAGHWGMIRINTEFRRNSHIRISSLWSVDVRSMR